jgi:Complex 1 protein (LYR family)
MLIRVPGQDACNSHSQPVTFHQPPPASGHRPSTTCHIRTDTSDATTLHMRVTCIVPLPLRCMYEAQSDCAARGSVDKRLIDGTHLYYCRDRIGTICRHSWLGPLCIELGCDAQMASQHMNVARLYRDILKAATRFPSVKRSAIVRDIKKEFHDNKVHMIAMLPQNQADGCAHQTFLR